MLLKRLATDINLILGNMIIESGLVLPIFFNHPQGTATSRPTIQGTKDVRG